MGDSLDNIRNAYLAGVIVGIILIAIGLFSLIHYLISSSFSDVYFGVFFVAIGSLFLWKGALAFIPIKQKDLPAVRTCPHCGAVVDEDATYCIKCNGKLD